MKGRDILLQKFNEMSTNELAEEMNGCPSNFGLNEFCEDNSCSECRRKALEDEYPICKE